jgi:hypothetical protein
VAGAGVVAGVKKGDEVMHAVARGTPNEQALVYTMPPAPD